MFENYPLQLEQTLLWGDMDAFGHINNKVYFRYFEDIRVELMRRTGMLEYMQETQIGPILASTRCDFRTPLVYPDTIRIGARITELAGKKITMQYLVSSDSQKLVAAEGSALLVYYDFNQGKSCPVPEVIMEAVRRY